MSTSFDDLAGKFLEQVGMPESPKDPNEHYLFMIEGPRQETHMMLLQEGETEGCLEVYTTVADGGLHPELLEIGLEQNLAAFRSKGNTFAIDREAECALLCGRYDPSDRDAGEFDAWLKEYLAEMELYHTIADKLTQDLMDTKQTGTDDPFLENDSAIRG